MQSSAKPTSSPLKRRLERESDQQLQVEVDEQRETTLPEIQNTNDTTPSALPKTTRGRGRPKKNTNPRVEDSCPGPSGSTDNSTVPNQFQQAGASTTSLTEFDLALEALFIKVRPSTVLSYRLPLEHWKHRSKYPVDLLYPYTVDPTEFVIFFFKEFVFDRTYKKKVSMKSDVRTQIALQNDEDEESRLNLVQMAENAPVSKCGKYRILEVPIGIEIVNKYKKALLFLHEFQFDRRKIEWPPLNKTKELMELTKKYEHNLIYNQVQTNADRGAHCSIRYSYKSGEFIRVLKTL